MKIPSIRTVERVVNLIPVVKELIPKHSTEDTGLLAIIKKQEDDIKKIQSLANKRLPTTIDFDKIPGLRMESREKFKQYAPKTIYDAQHIAGINPADIFVLVTFIEKYGKLGQRV